MSTKPTVLQGSRGSDKIHANPQPPTTDHPILQLIGKRVIIFERWSSAMSRGKVVGYKEGFIRLADASVTTREGQTIQVAWSLVDRTAVTAIVPEG